MSTLIMPNIKPLVILNSTGLWSSERTQLLGATAQVKYNFIAALFPDKPFAYKRSATLRLPLSIIKKEWTGSPVVLKLHKRKRGGSPE